MMFFRRDQKMRHTQCVIENLGREKAELGREKAEQQRVIKNLGTCDREHRPG